MNSSNLKILAKEAKLGLAEFDNGKFYVASEHTLNSFSTLVIQECVQTLVNYGYTDAADALKEQYPELTPDWNKLEFPEI